MLTNLTTIKSIEKTDIDNLSLLLFGTNDELPEVEVKNRLSNTQTFDNGDHMLKIWKDEAGQTKIAIQGVGESVTLITLAA